MNDKDDVRQALCDAIIAEFQAEDDRRIVNWLVRFEETHGRPPTPEEIEDNWR